MRNDPPRHTDDERAWKHIVLPPTAQFLREEVVLGGMDLLLLVASRHARRADRILERHGLGPAYHRLLYLLARRPGATVSQLLANLAITKQSFARVATELVRRDLVSSSPGVSDRRQRRLSLTEAGAQLERAISAELQSNLARAYEASGSEAVAGFWCVMQHLIGEEGRNQFRLSCALTPHRGVEEA